MISCCVRLPMANPMGHRSSSVLPVVPLVLFRAQVVGGVAKKGTAKAGPEGKKEIGRAHV